MGSVGFSLHLLLVSCVFVLIYIDRTPMETCFQMFRLLLPERQ